MDSLTTGRVVEERKNYYVVRAAGNDVRCTLKGAMLQNRARLCVGDAVRLRVINGGGVQGVICGAAKRQTYFPRPPLANLSQVIFVNTFKHPAINTEIIDRFLFSSAYYGIDAAIVFNKTDLLDCGEERELAAVEDYYRKTGYAVCRASVPEKQGVTELMNLCAGRTSAFAGLSGVGKSSLMALLFPDVEFRTGAVSGARGRGTHITTHTRLLPLDENTFVADTPGFAFADVPAVHEDTVAAYFPEIEKITGACRFNNCAHDAEPGCVVRELAETGEIAPWRREHYLKLYSEMARRRKSYERKNRF